MVRLGRQLTDGLGAAGSDAHRRGPASAEARVCPGTAVEGLRADNLTYRQPPQAFRLAPFSLVPDLPITNSYEW